MQEPSDADITRIEIALKHIESARAYTHSLLEGLSDHDWFWTPRPAVTHIAWQVGHLAFAQYGLALFRQRGRATVDIELMSNKFRKTFGKGSTPSPDRGVYPNPADILEIMTNIHSQVLKELPTFIDFELDEPIDPPHAGFPTRFGALLMAADHEMLHAGQIGLLRRLMGKHPLR